MLVTREELEPLGAALEARGLVAVHLPLVHLRPTGAPPPCRAPAQVLLTSAAGVASAPGLREWAGGARVIVVGDATARAARAAGLVVAAVASGSGADALAQLDPSLAPTVFVGAAEPAPAVTAALAAGGLLHWPVYARQEGPPPGAPVPADLALVTLASPSAARAWARLVGPSGPPVVVIGATTAAAAREAGLVVAAVAARPDLDALAEAAAGLPRP
ncbi:uroporphyrinogen-III synthase [Myxococcota bacterium]|nr:uroporphyrinogen-III synthase [Myxococcota bacterium]